MYKKTKDFLRLVRAYVKSYTYEKKTYTWCVNTHSRSRGPLTDDRPMTSHGDVDRLTFILPLTL